MTSFSLTNTYVEVKCISKKQSENWDKNKPLSHEIELQVPYDQNSIFYQMSGGTTLKLNTVNQQAADMFEIGKVYNVTIAPKEVVQNSNS
jgi:hypothetical protein